MITINKNNTNTTKNTFLIIILAFFQNSSFHLETNSKTAAYKIARTKTTHKIHHKTFQVQESRFQAQDLKFQVWAM